MTSFNANFQQNASKQNTLKQGIINSLDEYDMQMPLNAKTIIEETLTEKLDREETVSELAQLLLDNEQPWQVHNCKLLKLQCSNQGKLPLIYHYDQLSDSLKSEYPLNGSILLNFDKAMTAEQACEMIGVPTDSIASPKFVKITGTIVVFNEPLQLAVRLHWSNTSKVEDPIYCQTNKQAIRHAMDKWQFVGAVDTLYKLNNYHQKLNIVVYDEQAIRLEEGCYLLPKSDGYQSMPPAFTIALREQLNDNKQNLDWIEKAFNERLN